MSRILSGGGGISQSTADGLYVNITGDTMTGALNMNEAAVTILDDTVSLSGTSVGYFQVVGDDGLNAWSGTMKFGWNQTLSDYYTTIDGGKIAGPVGSLDIGAFSNARGIRAIGDLFPGGSYNLGKSALKWVDLYLSGDLYLGDDVILAADQTTDVGDETNGLRQMFFSDARTGSNRGRFRGIRVKGFANGEIYFGSDDIFSGYYVQKTVTPGSTALDNSGDITNLYQGDSIYPFISMMYDITRAGTTAPSNGVEVGRGGSVGNGGCGLTLGYGPSRGFELRLDNTVAKFHSWNSFPSSKVAELSLLLVGGTSRNFYPETNDDHNLGKTTNRWKDLHFSGKLIPASPQTYSVTNLTTDRTYDANSTSIDELADVLGTLISDLRTLGLVA